MAGNPVPDGNLLPLLQPRVQLLHTQWGGPKATLGG